MTRCTTAKAWSEWTRVTKDSVVVFFKHIEAWWANQVHRSRPTKAMVEQKSEQAAVIVNFAKVVQKHVPITDDAMNEFWIEKWINSDVKVSLLATCLDRRRV